MKRKFDLDILKFRIFSRIRRNKSKIVVLIILLEFLLLLTTLYKINTTNPESLLGINYDKTLSSCPKGYSVELKGDYVLCIREIDVVDVQLCVIEKRDKLSRKLGIVEVYDYELLHEIEAECSREGFVTYKEN